MITGANEPKDATFGEEPQPYPRHPADETNLSRILSYLMAEFGGQHWTRDLQRTESVVYLSTSGPRGAHFLGITEDFLRRYRGKDVVAAVAGRGLVERLRRVQGGMRVLVTKDGLGTARLEAPDAPPKRSPP